MIKPLLNNLSLKFKNYMNKILNVNLLFNIQLKHQNKKTGILNLPLM